MFSRVLQSKQTSGHSLAPDGSRAPVFSQSPVQMQPCANNSGRTEKILQPTVVTTNSLAHIRILTDKEERERNKKASSQIRSFFGAPDLEATFTPSVHPRLPPHTPAWTENGSIHLSPYALLLPDEVFVNVLAHERVHAIHHRIAKREESNKARVHAESLASGEKDALKLPVGNFLQPTPALLGFPPQSYAPWDRVIVGRDNIVGEVVDAGVTVRILLSYKDLKVRDKLPYQDYVCAHHGVSVVAETAKKMHELAQLAAQFNNSIPKSGAGQRIDLIAIDDTALTTGYRLANGHGMIWLKGEEFRSASYRETIFHEGSHAIFEAHSPTGGKPDAFALRIADLYGRLKDTKLVAKPTAKFRTKKPPLTGADAPAGVVMVTDVLWSVDRSAGHPWDDVSEFFASAYGCYRLDKALLSELVDYYSGADPKLGTLKTELLDILETATDPVKAGKVKPPSHLSDAVKIAKAVSPTPDESVVATSSETKILLNPSLLPQPPGDITCPGAKTKAKPIEKPNEPELTDPDDAVEKALKGSDK